MTAKRKTTEMTARRRTETQQRAALRLMRGAGVDAMDDDQVAALWGSLSPGDRAAYLRRFAEQENNAKLSHQPSAVSHQQKTEG